MSCTRTTTQLRTPVRLEPAAPRSRVKHSTTEPLHSLLTDLYMLVSVLYFHIASSELPNPNFAWKGKQVVFHVLISGPFTQGHVHKLHYRSRISTARTRFVRNFNASCSRAIKICVENASTHTYAM